MAAKAVSFESSFLSALEDVCRLCSAAILDSSSGHQYPHEADHWPNYATFPTAYHTFHGWRPWKYTSIAESLVAAAIRWGVVENQ